ncbi:MAG TPA: hypothetical protein VK131_03440 [Candidatus Acidoferrales bacterium]|nr:hypothetical protein [Candidatus Acidoferrales bacterium]
MTPVLPATPLLTTFLSRAVLAAALLLGACGSAPSRAPAYQVDRECQSAVPFASAYERVRARNEPRVEEVRVQLGAAASADATRASLRRLAAVLSADASDLATLPAPPGPTEQAALSALIRADEHMARESLALGDDPSGRFADHAHAWQLAAGARQQAADALSLRVALIEAKCS